MILALGMFLLLGLFVWSFLTDNHARFFPINNSDGRYTIVKSSKLLQGSEEEERANFPGLPEPLYYVEYRGDGVLKIDKEDGDFFRVTVGNSKVELESFIGKDVIVTKGKFVGSSKQCIVNKCTDIRSSFVVLDIDALGLAK
ncbi:MAG: hypothetical protein WD988_02880 [Candidatus Curtissbacteria bacterium]